MKQEIIDLLNRQFEPAAIKTHLLEKGFAEPAIEAAMTQVMAARSKAKHTTSATNGLRGLLYIASGIVLLLWVLINGRDGGGLRTGWKFIASLVLLVIGILKASRPLKEKT